ncbi:HAMP domain-containing protein [Affinibrenneria salicis]|uniref:HAMP domain-containing protein n=1 Tax=Affinibrenneria salicis TaxID=2590031 RepID=A0A5J5G4N7_9GAMM|nr:Tar ligand binding domain-containing protein [Affinibrenneria salicis]KAA9001824.1 HAMP domain-containing protein [Affinibrenneria salicis]
MFTFLTSRIRNILQSMRSRMSILSGLLLIMGLFSILQLFSAGVISNTITQLQQNLLTDALLRQQQTLMDQARMEVMIASDKLNRAGIYLMVDKETGSEGSWYSLMDEAEASLRQAAAYYAQLDALPAGEDAAGLTALKSSYQQLYAGLNELAQGLKQQRQIDIFFAIPLQAFQDAFAEKYASYLQETDAQLKQHGQQLLSSLDAIYTLFVTILILLALLSLLIWRGVNRMIIRPLRHIIQQLRLIAAGDLSHNIPDAGMCTREIHQLTHSVARMQAGLIALIGQIQLGLGAMLDQVDDIAQDNQRLSSQSSQQSLELEATTGHIVQLSEHLAQHTRHTRQASEHAAETSRIASHGEAMMTDVRAAMNDIAGHSKAMTSAIGLIENVAFQTHILSLNAAIEAAHAGEKGQGFAVVAREVGSLASQSSHSAQNINTLISNSDSSVVRSNERVVQLSDSLRDIIEAARGTSAFLHEIAELSSQQNHSIQEVSDRISTLNDSVQQNAAQVGEAARTFRHLQDQTRQLRTSVDAFILPTPGAENQNEINGKPERLSALVAQ